MLLFRNCDCERYSDDFDHEILCWIIWFRSRHCKSLILLMGPENLPSSEDQCRLLELFGGRG